MRVLEKLEQKFNELNARQRLFCVIIFGFTVIAGWLFTGVFSQILSGEDYVNDSRTTGKNFSGPPGSISAQLRTDIHTNQLNSNKSPYEKFGDTFEFTCSNGGHTIPYAVELTPSDTYATLKELGRSRCADEASSWNKIKGTSGSWRFESKQLNSYKPPKREHRNTTPISGSIKNFVSINTDNANVRTGPGTNYPASMELFLGYPLKVIKRKDEWLKVIDFENDSGWVHSSLIKNNDTDIVIAQKSLNMRSGPSVHSSIVADVERGVVMQRGCDKGKWIQYKHSSGTVGWVYTPLMWPAISDNRPCF